jgi:hypothetical protein
MILIACEFSGIVRDAFRALGHDAISCDLLPTEVPGPHLQQDILSLLDEDWDLIIAHPPCTHLAVSGARWWKDKKEEQKEAIQFVKDIYNKTSCPIAIENPIGILSTCWRKPDQIIQPWMFGHGETKATCLWLRDLPLLTSTNIVDGREARIHKEPPSKDRWKNRSRTYVGIAQAMAEQWDTIKKKP